MTSIEAALIPDQQSVVAYAGKIKQTEKVIVYLPDGTAVERSVDIFVSWDSIQQLLRMIRLRAGIKVPLAITEMPLDTAVE